MHGMCSASDLPNEANVIVVMQIIGEQIAIGNYLARVNDLYCANNIRSIIKGDAILEYFCLVSRV